MYCAVDVPCALLHLLSTHLSTPAVAIATRCRAWHLLWGWTLHPPFLLPQGSAAPTSGLTVHLAISIGLQT